jgi:hypothetical protein
LGAYWVDSSIKKCWKTRATLIERRIESMKSWEQYNCSSLITCRFSENKSTPWWESFIIECNNDFRAIYYNFYVRIRSLGALSSRVYFVLFQ